MTALLRAVDLVDGTVDRQLDHVRGGRLDRLFYRLSEAANHSILWHVIGLVSSVLPGGRRRQAVELSAVLGVESALVNGLIKSLIRRPRPAARSHRHALRTPLTSSFPSGHASSAFCAAVVLTRARPRGRPVWYSLAALVSISRAWVGIHHVSDVAVGAVTGHVLGRCAVAVLDRLDPSATASSGG